MIVRITALDTDADAAIAQLADRPGLHAAYVLRPMDSRQLLLVSAWDSVDQADQSPLTKSGKHFTDASYHDVGGTGTPAYGQLVHFDRPRTPREAAAIARADIERIWPAVRVVPGSVGALLASNPDGTSMVLALTTSLQAIEDSQQAIQTTELLPGEDPALLTGPDRIQLAWVLSTLPVPALSA
ncbi:MAG: hypothetical protein ACR2JO_06155 [Mycobacteriales bacterium]